MLGFYTVGGEKTTFAAAGGEGFVAGGGRGGRGGEAEGFVEADFADESGGVGGEVLSEAGEED